MLQFVKNWNRIWCLVFLELAEWFLSASMLDSILMLLSVVALQPLCSRALFSSLAGSFQAAGAFIQKFLKSVPRKYSSEENRECFINWHHTVIFCRWILPHCHGVVKVYFTVNTSRTFCIYISCWLKVDVESSFLTSEVVADKKPLTSLSFKYQAEDATRSALLNTSTMNM